MTDRTQPPERDEQPTGDRLELLFHRALALPDEDRAAWVAAQCGDDSALAAELTGLLEGHAEAPSCLETQGWSVDLLARGSGGESGQRLGTYEVLELLGEGGMGSVYRARQQEPLARDVALKLVKPGMDTREVLQRFEAERRLLARLNHPHIASVYDAGATPRGRPYFVMELVPGEPITRWCDRRRLPLAERLGLFVNVCEAVQHAHQKGVLHRDLKPGNVLVADGDGSPVPKVIDFGVAKAFEGPGRQGTLCTRQGQLIGTPGYMSPEQAAGEGRRVDTRSDVYSLGVMLYELLCGQLPLDAGKLREADEQQLRRELLESRPGCPSERLLALPALARARRARRRGCDLSELPRALRGNLDWIVMKAIAADPERRYASASELASDLRAHLVGDPVSAGPPGVGYRLAGTVARHRFAASTAAALLLALLTGPSLIAVWQGQRLATLERQIDALDEQRSEPPGDTAGAEGERPADCAECLASRPGPADLVLVRNAGPRPLHAGDVLAVASEQRLFGRVVFDVLPASRDGAPELLGPLARAVFYDGEHLHARPPEQALAPGQLGQAVARGSLAWVHVDGPVASLASLALSNHPGSATLGHAGEPLLGTVQSGWDGPGPGFVRATVAPSWPRPLAAAPAGTPTPGVLALASGAEQGPEQPAGVIPLLQGDDPPSHDLSDGGGSNGGGGGDLGGLEGKVHFSVLAQSRQHLEGAPSPWQQGSVPAPGFGQAARPLVLAPDRGRSGGMPTVGGEENDDSDLTHPKQAHVVGLQSSWADYDADGLDDLLLLREGSLRLMRNQGQGLFLDLTERLGLDHLPLLRQALCLVVDPGSRPELVLLDGEGSMRLLVPVQQGQLLDASAGSGLELVGPVNRLSLADPDRDGLPDLLAELESGTLLLLVNTGIGQFSTSVLAAQAEAGEGSSGEGAIDQAAPVRASGQH